MKELNFNDEDSILDELTYSSVVYNHEQGMDWEELAVLFPDNIGLMKMRYEQEQEEWV